MRAWSTFITLLCSSWTWISHTIGKMLWLPEEVPAQSCSEARTLAYRITTVFRHLMSPEIIPDPANKTLIHQMLPNISLRNVTIQPPYFMPSELGLQPWKDTLKTLSRLEKY